MIYTVHKIAKPCKTKMHIFTVNQRMQEDIFFTSFLSLDDDTQPTKTNNNS